MELEGLHLENLKYSLFLKRRFWPIFLSTFLGAFNDNLLRSGLVVLIAYSAIRGIELPTRPEILVTICSALLVMPMLLFSGIAGGLADKYEKSRLVTYTKIAEVGIMLCVFYGFATQNIFLLMAMLFVSGTHTTFYGPIKYSILPDHLSSKELLAGNGFMAGGSYLAILSGMIIGGLLVEMPGNIIGIVAVTIALIGLVASFFIPLAHPPRPETKINFHILKGSLDIVVHAYRDRAVVLAIYALSWFLLVGSVYISQFANYAQGVVHANNEVYILFLTLFSIGIAIGSLITDTLLKGEISARLMPYAAMGMSVFTYLMLFTTPVPEHAGLLNLREFVSTTDYWPMLLCMVLVAICGGIYMVPLYAIIQSRTLKEYRSRVMAASNLADSVFLTAAAIVSALLLSIGFDIRDLFFILATINLGAVGYARKITA
jgi:acyl-[acyl-carrier-protein]-phospholipid O-acyltransferase / long-chain-fatty-acid--[acyl-carrier-protein] ligase